MAQSKAKSGGKKVAKVKEPVDHKVEAKAKFSQALNEAKAGFAELGAEAKERASGVRDRATDKTGDWVDDAKAYGEQAKDKAGELAVAGKSKASDAISGLGQLVADNAEVIDEKVGEKYGDYARTASRKMQETAAKIESKSFEEMGDDARQFVRKSPGLAVGMAAVAGFVLARMLSGGRK